MHAVVRNYLGTGAKAVFDLVEERKADIETTMKNVPGVVSYIVFRSDDGGMTITVCEDRMGAEASVQAARAWLQANGPHLVAHPPEVTEGPVIVKLG